MHDPGNVSCNEGADAAFKRIKIVDILLLVHSLIIIYELRILLSLIFIQFKLLQQN